MGRRTAASLDGERLTEGQRRAARPPAGRGGRGPRLAAAAREARPRGDRGARERREPPRVPPERSRASSRPRAPAAALEARRRRPSALLLHGVTGSGKTEVYLRAAAAALDAAQGVIVLVPEIALDAADGRALPGALRRHRRGAALALGQGERYDEWMRLRTRRGAHRVGPRSAVFAPLERLGLVIVDEEHEAAYKHEGDPRYDARRVAARRAHDARRGAARRQRDAAARDGARAAAAADAPARRRPRRCRRCEIARHARPRHPLHPDTRARARRRRARKAIVLLNRRGWSNFLTCRTCGKVWECPDCDVALVLHRASGAVACHHCGHRERVPTRCDACGSVAVARHGAGTERIEHELRPRRSASRSSGSTPTPPRPRRGRPTCWRASTRRRRACCVGTQMVAKGHDFPDVTLGVVLDADATLRFPDFRAEERTFALIAQLAGRAGRGPRGGRVLVQTVSPDAPAIPRGRAHDAAASSPASSTAARRCATRRSPTWSASSASPRTRARRAPPPAGWATDPGAGRRRPRPGAAVPPARPRALPGRGQDDEREAAIAAVSTAVEGAGAGPRIRRVAFSVDVDPQ